MAGTLIADTLQASSGHAASMDEITQGCAKAWVNFDGTGTVTIRDSFNVSSITDNGVGDYTVVFTNAMPNANYSVAMISGRGVAAGTFVPITESPSTRADNTSTQAFVYTITTASTLGDTKFVNVVIFGD